MLKDTLAYQSFKNASYGALSFGVPILLSIVITPIFVRRLGLTDYGIYLLTNTLLGVLALSDLGLIAALTKYISQYHAQEDLAALKKLSYSANSLYLVVGFVGFLTFFILGKFFLSLFHITGASQTHILIVFLLAGGYFFVNSANSLYTTIPQALQRFDITARINLIQAIAFSLAGLGLVLFGFKLKAIMAANLLILVCITFVYYHFSKKLLPDLRLRLAWDKWEIKKMYTYGFFAAIGNLATGALNQLDRLIIPIFLGPVQLSYYGLPGNVAQKVSMVTSSLAGVWILPLASSLHGTGETDRLAQIHRKVIRNVSILAAAIALSIIFFGQKILLFWVGSDFAQNGRIVLPILTATYFILAIFSPTYHVLLGMGREKYAAGWTLLLAALNLILLFPLVKFYGINGAAWAFLLSVLPVYYVLYWIEKKVFGLNSVFKFYFVLYSKLLLTSGVFYALVNYVIIPRVNNLVVLVIAGPLCVLLFLGLYKLFGFVEDEDWQLFMLFARQVKAKILGSPL